MLDHEYAGLDRLLKANAIREATSALVRIGKKFEDPRPGVVEPLLQHPNPTLRAEALFVLCCCWRLPAYRPVAERIWRDPEVDEEDRGRALMAWACFDWHTKNPDTLRFLADLLCDQNLPPMLRSSAEDEIYAVAHFNRSTMPGPEYNPDDIEGSIHWARVRVALASAGVEAPHEMPER